MDRDEFEAIKFNWKGDPWKIPVLIMSRGDQYVVLSFSEYEKAKELAAEGFIPTEIGEVSIH